MPESNSLEASASFSNTETIYPPFSVVIPVYNEEKAIEITIKELHQILKSAQCTYEIIVVNDGSTDNSLGILANCPQIKVIDHQKNRGYGAALKTGIRNARYPLIVITDGDGTYPNERIPELIELSISADMVVGARIGANVQYSNLRKIPKWFLVRFAEWISQFSIPDLNSGMRVLKKDIVQRFVNILPDTFSFTTTITIAMLTNNYIVRYHPINYYHRVGASKIKPIRDTLRFIQLILRTGVYFAPLRIFLPVSGIFSLGFCISLFQDLFVRRDLTEATLIFFVAAIQLAMFALLADMIDKRNRY
jgi:glycosyltransferase involved in cell wall biosynthesis